VALVDTAVALEDSSDRATSDREGDEDLLLVNLETLLKSYLDQKHLLEHSHDLLRGFERRLASGQDVVDILASFQEESRTERERWNGLSDYAKYGKSPQYSDFREQVWAVHHSTPCPAMSSYLSRVRPDGEEDDDDTSDIEMGGQTLEYKCPITLKPFEEAIASKKCKHKYSGAAIREHIQAHRGRAQCPVDGCAESITLGDLRVSRTTASLNLVPRIRVEHLRAARVSFPQSDAATQKRSDQAKRRLRRRVEEARDDEDAVSVE